MTPLGYAGQYTLAQSGLQYLRAHVYDPVTGQFLTRDPLVELTREPYVYAYDNPLNVTDPTGRLSFSDVTHAIGNTISNTPSAIGHAADYLNPLKYYEEEIESWESDCSYWSSVAHGLEGAGVLTLDIGVVALTLPVDEIVGGLAAADY
jgi:RHS repeat-associated protein